MNNISYDETDNQPYVLDHNFIFNPWDLYDKLRTEGPITKVITTTGTPVWFITGYNTAKQILSDHRIKRDMRDISQILLRYNLDYVREAKSFDDPKGLEAHMYNRGDSDHTRLRKLTMKAFSPKNISQLSQKINEIAFGLISQFPVNQQFNISEALSYPLPMTIICEILGVPEGVQRDEFKKNTYIMMNSTEFDPEVYFLARDFIYDNLQDIITCKRADLNFRAAKDVLDELILARDNEDRLNDRELISNAFLLLAAGHGPVEALLNETIIQICKRPGLVQQLRDDPSQTSAFIEEVLRVVSPIHFSGLRYAAEKFTIENKEIMADDLFVISFLATNHDPSIFFDPDMIMLNRNQNHLAFSHGAHNCLGAHLARLEAVTAVNVLLEQFSEIVLAVPESELMWRPSGIIRERTNLPVILQR